MATIDKVQVGNVSYDIAESGYSLSDVYSTEETRVGTWIDGKSIYQRTWTGLNFGDKKDTWTNTGVTISNVKSLIYGVAIKGSDNRITPLYLYRPSGNNIQYYCITTLATHDILTLQYTKTTD